MKLSDYPKDWRKISEHVRVVRAGNRCECIGECGIIHSSTHLLLEPARCPSINKFRRIVIRKSPLSEVIIDGDLSLTDPSFLKLGKVSGVIVLTTAHLCKCFPKCGNLDHLKAMCQRCHLKLDGDIHKERRARNLLLKKERDKTLLSLAEESDILDELAKL